MAMKKKMAAAAGAITLTLVAGGTAFAAQGLAGLPGLPGGAARGGGGQNQQGADGANGANGNGSGVNGGNGGASGKTGSGGKGAPGGAGARGGDVIIRGGQGAAHNTKRQASHAHKHGRAEDPQPNNGFDF